MPWALVTTPIWSPYNAAAKFGQGILIGLVAPTEADRRRVVGFGDDEGFGGAVWIQEAPVGEFGGVGGWSELAVGNAGEAHLEAFFYQDLVLPVLIDSLKTGWQADEPRRSLSRLISQDGNGVFRNTLDFRLRRVED